jgi:cold-inducible RNA-binding protein
LCGACAADPVMGLAVVDRDSGLSKGFGFITMTAQADADKAISMFNVYSLGDHELKVNIAKPRVER